MSVSYGGSYGKGFRIPLKELIEKQESASENKVLEDLFEYLRM